MSGKALSYLLLGAAAVLAVVWMMPTVEAQVPALPVCGRICDVPVVPPVACDAQCDIPDPFGCSADCSVLPDLDCLTCGLPTPGCSQAGPLCSVECPNETACGAVDCVVEQGTECVLVISPPVGCAATCRIHQAIHIVTRTPVFVNEPNAQLFVGPDGKGSTLISAGATTQCSATKLCGSFPYAHANAFVATDLEDTLDTAVDDPLSCAPPLITTNTVDTLCGGKVDGALGGGTDGCNPITGAGCRSAEVDTPPCGGGCTPDDILTWIEEILQHNAGPELQLLGQVIDQVEQTIGVTIHVEIVDRTLDQVLGGGQQAGP